MVISVSNEDIERIEGIINGLARLEDKFDKKSTELYEQGTLESRIEARQYRAKAYLVAKCEAKITDILDTLGIYYGYVYNDDDVCRIRLERE